MRDVKLQKYDKLGDPYVWVQVINGTPVQIFTDRELSKEIRKYGTPPGIKRARWAGKY
jgi:hypothetical protein